MTDNRRGVDDSQRRAADDAAAARKRDKEPKGLETPGIKQSPALQRHLDARSLRAQSNGGPPPRGPRDHAPPPPPDHGDRRQGQRRADNNLDRRLERNDRRLDGLLDRRQSAQPIAGPDRRHHERRTDDGDRRTGTERRTVDDRRIEGNDRQADGPTSIKEVRPTPTTALEQKRVAQDMPYQGAPRAGSRPDATSPGGMPPEKTTRVSADQRPRDSVPEKQPRSEAGTISGGNRDKRGDQNRAVQDVPPSATPRAGRRPDEMAPGGRRPEKQFSSEAEKTHDGVRDKVAEFAHKAAFTGAAVLASFGFGAGSADAKADIAPSRSKDTPAQIISKLADNGMKMVNEHAEAVAGRKKREDQSEQVAELNRPAKWGEEKHQR